MIYFSSSLGLLLLPDNFNFRKIPKSLLILLGLILVYYVGYFFVDGKWGNAFFIFKMLSFVAITLFVYSQNLRITSFFDKLSWPFFFMWAAILALTTSEIYQLRIVDLDIRTDRVLSTFGNVNMMTEFFILCLPLFFVWSRKKDKIPEWVKLVGLSFLSFFLLYGRSRSAWLGLILWFAFRVFRGITKKECVAFGIAAAAFAVSHFTAPDVSKISKFVASSFSERASLYRGSLELLRDKPTGIPLGQFMNEIVPYLLDKETGPNEFAFFDQPHSEFLKWGIQFGWAFLGLCILFFWFLSYELFKKYRLEPEQNKSESGFYIEFLLVLFPQMMFQFPFENPASILCIAVVFGLFLSSYSEGVVLRIQYFQYIFGVLAVAGLLNSFLYATSIYFESAYSGSPDIMNVVCNYYPVSFRSCNLKNKSLLQIKNIAAFKAEFQKDFLENPYFCDNLRLLPEYFNYSQSEKKTCEALLVYREIYKDQKNFTTEAFVPCAKYTSPIKLENPLQFNRDFLKWFQN